jgi:hypothetical protein
MRRVAIIAAAIIAVVLPSAAQGQNPVELGLDGALATTLDSPRVTDLSIPIQRLRVGFFTSPRVSIEPYGALNYGHIESSNFTDVNFGVGGLYHFGAARSAPQPYVRPFAELHHTSTSSDFGSGGTTAFALGGGVGVKVPVSNRFAWRFEAALTHAFEHDHNDASTSLAGLFGLSVFLH